CSPFRGPTKSWRTKSSGRFCRSLPIPTSASFSQRSSRCPNHSPVTCSAENLQAIDRVLQSLSFGGGAVNQTNIFLFIESMPYRGVGTSGIGNYDWKYGYDSLTHAKSVLVSPPGVAIDHLFPPYTMEKVQA